jgi:hypothetical protein
VKKFKLPPPPAKKAAADIPPAAPKPIILKVNTIVPDPNVAGGARFVHAGEQTPWRDLSEVPAPLKPFITTGEPEPEPADDEPRSVTFQLNTVYELDSQGRRRARSIERQAANLQALAEEDTAVAEALSRRELDEETKAGLEEDRQMDIRRQRAEAQYATKLADAANEATQQEEEQAPQ